MHLYSLLLCIHHPGVAYQSGSAGQSGLAGLSGVSGFSGVAGDLALCWIWQV
jgi:hypothetical protein